MSEQPQPTPLLRQVLPEVEDAAFGDPKRTIAHLKRQLKNQKEVFNRQLTVLGAEEDELKEIRAQLMERTEQLVKLQETVRILEAQLKGLTSGFNGVDDLRLDVNSLARNVIASIWGFNQGRNGVKDAPYLTVSSDVDLHLGLTQAFMSERLKRQMLEDRVKQLEEKLEMFGEPNCTTGLKP